MSGRRVRASRKVWVVTVTATATVLLLYQVSLNLEAFLQRPAVFLVTLEPNLAYRLPPVSFCLHPPFQPSKLKQLGVDISGDYLQVQDNLLSLRGLPEDFPVSRLWHEAHWDIDQVIRIMTIRNKSIDDKAFERYRRRSFSPLGPCLTINPPPGEHSINIFLEKTPEAGACTWTDEDGLVRKYSGHPGECQLVQQYCNTTCGFEEFIFYSLSVPQLSYVYFHDSGVYADSYTDDKEAIMEYSKQLFDESYDLKILQQEASIVSRPQLVESNLIKGSCIADDAYRYGHCSRQLQISKASETLGCLPVYGLNFDETLKTTCSSAKLIYEFLKIDKQSRGSCRQKCKRQKWIHDSFEIWGPDFSVVLEASTTDMRREEEVESYPLNRLLSDTGGSLGLFIGVSLLNVWDAGIQFCFHSYQRYGQIKDSKNLHHVSTLLHYTGVMTMSYGASVHSLQTLRSYVTQPLLTCVNLASYPITTRKLDDYSTVVARRLASRALDCRPQETIQIKCQVRCQLEEAVAKVAGVAPFINVEDLPPCENAGFLLPSFDYLVPPEMLVAATMKERVDKCTQACSHVQQTDERYVNISKTMDVYEHYLSFDILRLICSLGGIVGLYLGYSVVDALDKINTVLSKREAQAPGCPGRSFLLIWVKRVCIALLVAGLGLWQTHTFLLRHQMTSSTSRHDHNTPSPSLAITVCRWPPLSFPHLATALGRNISYSQILTLPKEERFPRVLQLLESLQGNWSTSPDELWRRAAWNVTDVIEGFSATRKDDSYIGSVCSYDSFCKEVWLPVYTPLNRCFSINTTHNNSTFQMFTILFTAAVEEKDIFGLRAQIYFTVNPSDEPPLMADMIGKKPYQKITATLHSVRYERYGGMLRYQSKSDASHSSCIEGCLSDGTERLYGCSLPNWGRKTPQHMPPCNQSQYANIPNYFKGLDGIGEEDWMTLRNEKNTSRDVTELHDDCYTKCRHLRHTFHRFSVERGYDPYPMLLLKFLQEEAVVVVREEDRHTTAQFLSDIGGLAGAIAGVSLLYLCRDLLPRLFT